MTKPRCRPPTPPDGGRRVQWHVHTQGFTRLRQHLVRSLVFGSLSYLTSSTRRNMLRDESVYPDPHAFNPARFLAPADEATVKRRDPRHYVFGFGRRRCPGAHLIEQSLWIVIATAVATLDIHKPIGPDGKTLEQKVVFENSVFRCVLFSLPNRRISLLTMCGRLPSSFQCDIRPRSSQTLRVVREATDALGI